MSDVDIHVFAWDASDVEAHVSELGWVHETQRVSIVKHGKVMEFTHVHVPDVFPIELTVYPPNELRNRPRSSTDGKPIVRIRDRALRAICEREHRELWHRYLADGSTPSMHDILTAEESEDSSSRTEAASDLLDGLLDAPFDDAGREPVDHEAEGEDADEEREPRIRRPPGRQRRRRVMGIELAPDD